MTYHPDSFPLTQYLRRTIPELVAPIETILWAAWKPGDDTPDALADIYIGFYIMAVQFANVDKDISEIEAALLRDVQELFEPELGGILFWDMDIIELHDRMREVVRKDPKTYSRIRIPYVVTLLEVYDDENGTDYAAKARAMYFRFANAIVKADGKITKQEETALSSFKEMLYPSSVVVATADEEEETVVKSYEANKEEKPRSLDELLQELNSLVGLEAVKTDVIELVNFIKVQQLRQSKAMATVPISRHLVFYGNPGTGKTTVARLLSQIYKSLNVVSRGHLVETDRSGLVAGYVGQTALKVKEMVTKALGGILFIDEAYALTGDDQNYGQEAIDTLIKLMEDHRDDLIVVVAGYPDKMNKFLLSNPGLKSRFNKFLSFEDYNPSQLVKIFELFCKNSDFQLSEEARKKVLAIFQVLHVMRDETFGNARLARNVFERTINNQASRIISMTNVTEEILSTIEAVDIPGEVELHTIGKTESVIAADQGDRNQARVTLVEAIKHDPRNLQAWLQLSELVDKPEQAIDCLERVLKLDPSNKLAQQRLEQLRARPQHAEFQSTRDLFQGQDRFERERR